MIAPRLDDLLGHEGPLALLARCRSGDRVPHAMLFCGPDGVGKRAAAVAFARALVTGGDPEDEARFDRAAHDRFVLYEDLTEPVPVTRAELLPVAGDEATLLAEYELLEAEAWISGVSARRGDRVVDLLARNPERFTGRKGIPFADVLQRELAALERSRKSSPVTVEVARRLFSGGTSRAYYRRNLGIELINGRGDGAYFRTVESLLARSTGGGWRVAVLDNAHRMTEPAENAFLKTLEEPPPNTLLVLVTSEELSLLPTTVSRCARVRFDALPADLVAGHLRDTQGLTAADANVVASLAEGSLRRALELRDQDFTARRAFLAELLPAVADGNLGRCLALTGGYLGDLPRDALRGQTTLLLELLALAFRDLAIVASVPDAAGRSGVPPELVRELVARQPVERWEQLFARTEVALSDVRHSVEPRLAVEGLLVDALPAVVGS